MDILFIQTKVFENPSLADPSKIKFLHYIEEISSMALPEIIQICKSHYQSNHFEAQCVESEIISDYKVRPFARVLIWDEEQQPPFHADCIIFDNPPMELAEMRKVPEGMDPSALKSNLLQRLKKRVDGK
jgi:hypothetical protein